MTVIGVLTAIWRDEHGGPLVEYALVFAFLSAAAIAGLQLFGSSAGTTLNNQAQSFQDLQSGP